MLGTLARQETSTRAVPVFAKPLVRLIAGIVAVAQFVASFGNEYWLDEVAMLGLSRHPLQFGYADQPPVAVLLAKAMDSIAPGSMLVLHLPAILATAATVVVAALIARELGGDRRAQVITAFTQAGTWWIAMAGHWLSPYALEPLIWGLLFFVLLRWIRTRSDGLLLWLGVVIGIGAETKFQIFLLCGLLVVSVLIFGPRELLRTPKFWAGAGIAVLIAAPTLIWQALHGWPQLRMGSIVTTENAILSGGRGGTALGMIGLAGVVGVVLFGYGLWRLLRDPGLRFIAVTVLGLWVFFVITSGRPYYLGGCYAVVFAAGALGLQRRRESGHTGMRWFIWPAAVLSAACMASALYASQIFVNTPGMPTGERFASHTANALRALPAEQREHTAVLGASYIVAGYLDAYAPQYGLPEIHSPGRAYGYFAPPEEDKSSVLYVGGEPGPKALRPYFGQVRRLGPDLWLCTEKRDSWAAIWPKIRTLKV